VQTVGLCHGVFMGMAQIARILGRSTMDGIEYTACGLNHCTWFQSIRDRRTGADLYPEFSRREREGDWLSDWHELALSRTLFRRFGLWPSPGANHIGEYFGWAEEFYAGQLQYYHDPVDGPPWKTGREPEFLYTVDGSFSSRPWIREPKRPRHRKPGRLKPSSELAIPILESLYAGVRHNLPAINVPNAGAIPNLPPDAVVEVPAVADESGLHPRKMEPLPEAIAAVLRLQASINKLLVEAFAECSKAKLLQAVLLDPTVSSYRNAIACVDELCALQRPLLPTLR